MTETARTITFVAVALASAVAAWFVTPSVEMTPAQLAGASEGKQFFPDLLDANDPTSITVVAWDDALAARKQFKVEFKNGLWTIPSHHGYPADGAKKLAETANSLIGIKRDKFKSNSEQDHEQLGVVDPLDTDGKKLKGRGQRLTLTKGETALADLIIGKKVRDQEGYYYVRLPSEKSTYTAKLNINLSTKFADWIETDLLKVSRDELTQISIDDYTLDADPNLPVVSDVTTLEKPKPTDTAWKLQGLDEATEELETAKVNDLVNTLDELKLVGVRQKQKGINADLTFDREVVQNRLILQALVEDLGMRGFEVRQDRNNPEKARLYARGGELLATTNKGVEYTLRFGDVFSGDESEIEVGGAEKKAEGEKKDDEKEGADKAAEKTTGSQSRYLFISARFDEARLGAEPEKPTPPEGLPADVAADVEKLFQKKPARVAPGKGEKDDKPDAESAEGPAKGAKKEEECVADDDVVDEQSDKTQSEKGREEDKPQVEPAAPPKVENEAGQTEAAKAEQPSLADLKRQYRTLWERFDADQKAHEEKVKQGKEKASELNLRFGDWYYVISADSYKKLHQTRKDLVKQKAGPKDKAEAGTFEIPKDSPADADGTKKTDE